MFDLRRVRRDLRAFATAVGLPLADFQADALRLDARVTAIVAPRQSGKSRSLALLALWWAFRRSEQRVLVVSAGEDASRRLLATVRRTAADSPLLRGSVVDEQAGLVTLSNGSEVRSVSASERQVRGWSVDLLLCDEAALVPDDLLLGAAFPTTAARPDARIVLASSATTAAGAFFDHVRLGEAGSEHVRAFRWALSDCPWIAPSAIEAARESLSEVRFAAEYLGEFASGSDALFTRASLDRATADYPLHSLGNLTGPARVLGGVDWGQTTDRSALVVIARFAVPGERLFGVVCAERWPAGAPPLDVAEQIARSPAHFDTLAAETNGLGGPCADHLFRCLSDRSPDAGGGQTGYVLVEEGLYAAPMPRYRRVSRGFATRRQRVHATAESKAATYSALRLLFDQGRLVLPASAEDLLRELLMLRVDLAQTGTERIEASAGHDDLADALALALVPYRERGGAWRTYLAGLAHPRYPLPEPELPRAAAALPTVRTGAGRELPRTPFLVSVAGSEVTPPAGADLTDPRERELRAVARAAAERYERTKGASCG